MYSSTQNLSERLEIWSKDKNLYYETFLLDPYLIAEIGVNHESDLDLAKNMCLSAKESGANCVKFQTYKAELIASKNAKSYWDLNENPELNQFELFKNYDSFGESEYIELKKYCDSIEIDFMSTPFDIECLNWLNKLVDAFKISSSDITNKLLIEEVDTFEKPIIFSTGASTLDEIINAKNLIKNVDSKKIVINHCVLNYPTKIEDANLNRIKMLKEEFPNNIIGYSDHTKPTENLEILIESIYCGATILEKHFTYDKKQPGNDHFHSMNASDIKNFRAKLEYINKLRGLGKIDDIDTQLVSRKNARRSLVANGNISKGERITKNNIIAKRPGTGISPNDVEKLIGKIALHDINDDEILDWKSFS